MSEYPIIAAMDLEGVLVPEVWITFAEATGIDKLKLTTRDEPNYDVLMQRRLSILRDNKLKLVDIQKVIAGMSPLDGAAEYMQWLTPRFQNVILSDTYYEFASPLMKKLNWPPLFCNSMEVDRDGNIVDYKIRLPDGKRQAVLAFRRLNFRVIAIGDSYNDINMLKEAELGILFRPPETVEREFPELPVAGDFNALKRLILEFASG